MITMKMSGFDGFKIESPNDSKINGLIHALRCKDMASYSHSERVAVLACKLAKTAGCSASETERIRIAALLHDIGKLNVTDQILFKAGPLTIIERKSIAEHPRQGYRLIRPLFGYHRIASIILEHHERYDGMGYPKGIGGEKIRIGARIIAICDAYDAMNSHRAYAKPMTHESSINELVSNKGTQFDPQLVDLFLQMISCGNN